MGVHVGIMGAGTESEPVCCPDLNSGLAIMRGWLCDASDVLWRHVTCGCVRADAFACGCPACFTEQRLALAVFAIDCGQLASALEDAEPPEEAIAIFSYAIPDGAWQSCWIAVGADDDIGR